MTGPTPEEQAMGTYKMINHLRENEPERFAGYLKELKVMYSHFCVYVHAENGTTYTHILNMETVEFEQPVGAEDQAGNFVSVVTRKYKLHNVDK